jgi:hypothetical protein
MKKLASNLPIQQMIANAINAASEKLAEDESSKDSKVNKLLAYEKKEHGHIPTPREEEAEKMASATSEEWVEKLAAAVESIVDNFDNIDFPQKSILQKAAEEAGSPRGSGKGPGSLEVSKAIGGQQSYERGHAKNDEASTSKANEPLSGARPHDGKGQLENNMHHAAGGGDVKPTGKYPEKGPLVSGPSAGGHHKEATIEDIYKQAGIRAMAGKAVAGAKHVGKAVGGHLSRNKGTYAGAAGGAAGGAVSAGLSGAAYGAVGGKKGQKGEAAKAGAKGGAILGGASGAVMGGLAGRALRKHASLRDIILSKLAGEDVMKANIDADASANPLAGMGQLESFDAEKESPHQAGNASGGGFGNQARRLIASNQAAIDATKGDAKGPVKTQLSEVLEEPALSSSTDSVLENNLRNTGKAGVKIAAARMTLEKVAAQGCTCNTIEDMCAYCNLKQKVAAAAQGKKESVKTANAMMGEGGSGGGMPPSGGGMGGMGMSAMAEAGAGADGCTCGGVGECKVCKLKAALAAAKGQGAMAPAGPMGAHPMGQGGPVEKDSNGPGCGTGMY